MCDSYLLFGGAIAAFVLLLQSRIGVEDNGEESQTVIHLPRATISPNVKRSDMVHLQQGHGCLKVMFSCRPSDTHQSTVRLFHREKEGTESDLIQELGAQPALSKSVRDQPSNSQTAKLI